MARKTLLNSELSRAIGLASPIRRYTQRLTRAVESTQSELVTILQQLIETQELLCTRQKRKRGKKILLKGKYVFSTEEVLEIAKEAEMKTAANEARKQRKSSSAMVEVTQTKVNMFESGASEAEFDCIVVASLRQF